MKEKNSENKVRRKVVVEEVVDEKPVDTPKTEEPKLEEVKKPLIDEMKEESPKLESDVKSELKKDDLEVLRPNPKFNLLWIIIPCILMLIAVVGGVFVYEQGVSSQKAKLSEATPTPTFESATPTPTPTPQVDLTKYQITILNGSGIAGEGGRARDLLTSAGFKVATVDNANSYDFTKTQIKAKDTIDKTYLAQLKTTLGKDYVVDSMVATLSAGQIGDLIITIGSSKPQ